MIFRWLEQHDNFREAYARAREIQATIYADEILTKLLHLKDDGSFRMDMSYFDYCQGLTMTSKKFEAMFGGPPRRPESSLTQREMDMAASVQVVGGNVATSPGKVVFQNDLIQLLQYAPRTEQVYTMPLLIVPPWINKFYILDLKPQNSFIKWATEQGYTVFVISWVNPDEPLSKLTFEDYMKEGPLAALDAIEKATGVRKVSAIGYCIGGTLMATTLAYMAAPYHLLDYYMRGAYAEFTAFVFLPLVLLMPGIVASTSISPGTSTRHSSSAASPVAATTTSKPKTPRVDPLAERELHARLAAARIEDVHNGLPAADRAVHTGHGLVAAVDHLVVELDTQVAEPLHGRACALREPRVSSMAMVASCPMRKLR